MRGEGLSSSVPVQIFRGTRLTYLDERTKTPAGQTLVLKPIQNVRQVPLKNPPKSPFQRSLLLSFLPNVIKLINAPDSKAAGEKYNGVLNLQAILVYLVLSIITYRAQQFLTKDFLRFLFIHNNI